MKKHLLAPGGVDRDGDSNCDDALIVEAHRLFKALGHETRYAIVQLLIERKLFCGDLVAELGLPQSTVSHHLKILRDAGVVETETRGNWVCYVLKSQVIETTLYRFIASLPRMDVSSVDEWQRED